MSAPHNKRDRQDALKLFHRVALRCDLPEHGLRRGDVATLVDFADASAGGGECGCILEVFNALGESLAVAAVPISQVEPLRADEVLAVRTLTHAA